MLKSEDEQKFLKCPLFKKLITLENLTFFIQFYTASSEGQG